MDNLTILDGGVALHAHTAVGIAGGQGLAAQVQGNRLGDSQLISAVVDISGMSTYLIQEVTVMGYYDYSVLEIDQELL